MRTHPLIRTLCAVTAAIAAAALTGCATIVNSRTTSARAHSTRPPAGALALVSEPQAGAAPFLALIAGAKHTITLTMYELHDPRIEHALAAAAHRGVNVRVLLNGGYYSQREPTNQPADRYLAGHGVHVRYTPTRFALTHQKTLVIDRRTAVVMTLNFDGLYASTRDFAIVDRQHRDVAAIARVFDDDYAGRDDTPSSGTGDLVWSPGAQNTVLRLIRRAKHSIRLENEEMAYTPATNALCAAARRHVRVQIVMTYESDWRTPLGELTRCGADVRLYHGQAYYIHAKVLLIDGHEALVSSQNLSTTSLERNRELGIRLSAPKLTRQLTHALDRDYQRAPRS